LPAAVTALLTAAVFAAAQTPQAAPPPMRSFPAPTNLKVLPKDLTGQQVHDIMEKIAGSLGVHCDTCHTADPNNIGPNGRPRMNFADDSKPEKNNARLMITMTEDINKNYVSKVADPDKQVSCGTCHRGKLHPEAFVIPPDERGPRGAPPAGAMQPPPTQ
jgi:ferredoxin